MDSQCVVSIVAMLFQLAGWSSLLASQLTRNERTATLCEFALLFCLIGLGSVTLAAALQQSVCALTTGAGIGLLMMAVLAHPHHRDDDPYARIYPPERVPC